MHPEPCIVLEGEGLCFFATESISKKTMAQEENLKTLGCEFLQAGNSQSSRLKKDDAGCGEEGSQCMELSIHALAPFTIELSRTCSAS